MRLNKKKIKYVIIMLLGASILIFSILLANESDKNAILTSSIIENKKIGWGIKRNNNHEQPDVGSKNREVLENNNGICLGNKEKKILYLTFDEGYEAGYTSKILKTLKENQVKATFFITAHYLNTQADLVKQMIEEGHIVGNHTVNHKSMPDLSEKELKKEIMDLHNSIYEKFNYEMKYIRPPKGEFNERTLKKCEQLGYKTVMWSFAYYDWDERKQPSIEESKKMIIENFHCGEIMLLHPNSKTNSEVLDTIIKEAKNQGYEFKLLDQFK